MPITRLPTPDELQQIAAAGGNPQQYANKPLTFLTPEEQAIQQSQSVGTVATIGRTLIAHGGGILGGGGGALAGMEGGAALGALGGPAAPVTVPLGAILGGIGGAGLGSMIGQKAQQAIEPTDVYAQQQQAAEDAAQANPKTALATDIIGSAIASGGKPSLDALRAGKAIIGKLAGEALSEEGKKALIGTLMNAGVNPAINTGIGLATGQGLPSGTDLAAQVAGGALFSRQANWAAKLTGHGEPAPEVTNGNEQTTADINSPERGEQETPYSAIDEQGRYQINDNRIKQLFLSNLKKVSDITDPIEKAKAQTINDQLRDLAPSDMREQLHQMELAKTVQPETQEDKDYQGGEMGAGSRWQEPSPEVTNAAKPVVKDASIEETPATTQVPEIAKTEATVPAAPVSQNTLRLTQDKMLQSNIGRPEVKPSTAVEGELEAKAANQPTNDEPKTPAELTAEQFEQKGNVNAPPSDKPIFKGTQEGFGRIPATDYYNLVRPITDGTGKVIHSAGSTVSEHTLRKYGVDFDEKGIPKPKIDGSGKIGVPLMLQNHIRSNGATTGSILHSLANTPDHPFAPLAEELLNAADTKSLGVKWSHRPELDQSSDGTGRSHYDPNGDVVNIGTGSSADARVVMEEAVHSLTSKKIPHFAGQGEEHYNRLNQYLKSGSNEHVKNLIKAYFETAKALGVHDKLFKDSKDPFGDGQGGASKGVAGNADESVRRLQGVGHSTKYAMGNLDEFLAQAIKDPEFQKVLDSIKDSSNDKRTVWQNIVDAVRNLLGLDAKKGYMLDRVLRTGGELVAQNRPEEFPALLRGQRSALPKPPEEQSHTSDELHLPPDKYMGRAGAMLRSVLDKVRDIGTPIARHLADAGQKAKDQEDNLKGKWKNPVVQAGLKVSPANRIKIGEVMRRERLDGKLYPTAIPNDAASRRFYRLYRDKLTESGMHQLAIGEPITEAHTVNGKTVYTKRSIKMNDTYAPDMEKSHVTQVIKENKDQAAIDKILQTFHDFNTKPVKDGGLGLSEKDSAQRIANWKVSLQGKNGGKDVSHQDFFNARRKAAGQQLPPEFVENDPVRAAERYFDRAAIDASHYEHMEKDHKVLAALGQDKDAWGKDVKQLPNGGYGNNAAVKSMLGAWREEARNPADQNESSLSSLISAAFIAGPALELHKVVSNTVKTLSLAPNPIVALKAVTHAFMNVRAGYQHAVGGNVYRPTARSWRMMIDGNATAAEKMQGLARIIRQVSTLGDITTKVSAGLVQAMNEVIIPSKIARAEAGDITSQKFLRNLDPTYNPKKIYSSEEVQQLASRSANYIHGTGDIRSMPAWMLNDSEFSGFFSLAHWSIAQTNNFMKDIYEPALRGDIKPLLTGVFGAAIGGYLIKELRQDIQGKKSPVPSLTEIAASDRGIEGNHGLVAYNMITAMQYAGFGGLLSQLAKYPFDAAYKNNPQGATFPMDEVASDLASTLHQVSTAIANDPNVNWVDLAKAVTMHTLSTNFQLSRIAINQGINHGLITGLPAEKKELSDKMGQLRRFDMVEGLPYNEIDEASNPYMNIEQKNFKMEQDPQKAVAQLPALVQNIMETYHGTPDVMMSKLKALKENSYATFPSLEQAPLSFMKYIGYLQREEGPEAAQQELMDYMKHKVVNEAKASVVP